MSSLILPIAASAIVLAIAAAVWERVTRRRATDLLKQRRFESLLSDLSFSFVSESSTDIEGALRAGLERVRAHCGLDLLGFWRASPECLEPVMTRTAPGVRTETPWTADAITRVEGFVERVRAGEPFTVRVDDDGMAAESGASASGFGVCTVVPLSVAGHVAALFIMASHGRRGTWRDGDLERLRRAGRMFAAVLAVDDTEARMRSVDTLNRTILSSLPAGIAVLDRSATIISVNEAWLRLAAEQGACEAEMIGVGASYFEWCHHLSSRAGEDAARISTGVDTVCRGLAAAWEHEYSYGTPADEQWFVVAATALRRREGGAIVVHRDITERKRAEAALRESEQHFRLMADAAPVMIWMGGNDKGRTYFNRGWLEFTGRSMQQELGSGWAEGVDPADLAQCLDTYHVAYDRRLPFRMEYRLRRHDGQHRSILETGVPWHRADGGFAGYLGSCLDVSEMKDAEHGLRELSGRLIAAQEDERRRIARELHDDVSQRLALVALELEQLRLHPPESATELTARSQALSHTTTEIATELHRISHRLHPSRLEALGLVAAIHGFCRELSAQHQLQVRFAHDNVPRVIGADIALCFFRIVQEALQNIVKHSGVHEAEVQLTAADGELNLRIADPGAGFWPDARFRGGLGLISMRERVHALGGSIVVLSAPGRGTRIGVRASLQPTPVPNVRVSDRTRHA